jgi:hypothetical protein
MALKHTEIFDLNLFSGSSELLRQTAGGYYVNDESSRIVFQEPSENIAAIVDSAETSDPDTTPAGSLTSRISYATRLAILDESAFSSDAEWKTYLLGGTFGSKTYPGLYNEAVYADHYNTASLPYVPRELVNTERQPQLTITTEYFNHYPRYQTKVANLESELQAPNLYLLPEDILDYDESVASPMGSGEYPKIKNFLTNSFVNSSSPIDPRLKNLFIVNNNVLQDEATNREDIDEVLGTGKFDDDLNKKYSLMPFGSKIRIEQDLVKNSSGRSYRDIVEDNEYEIKLLKLLKETFQNEIPLRPSTVNFGISTTAEISNGRYESEISQTTTIPARVVDAPSLFLYGYRNYLSETNDVTILSSSSDSFDFIKGMVFDLTGTYRYRYSTNNINMFTSLIGEMNTKFANSEESINNINDFLKQANESKYHETIAYRVQKIGGQPTGDANTENTIQNIWFYNSGDAIDYLDTQVKYDTEYTYKMYKYDIIQGYKYQLSDMIATRKIADTSVEGIDLNCLEFYNLTTGEATGSLLETSNLLPRINEILQGLESEKQLLEEQQTTIQNFIDLNQSFLDLIQDRQSRLDDWNSADPRQARTTYFPTDFVGGTFDWMGSRLLVLLRLQIVAQLINPNSSEFPNFWSDITNVPGRSFGVGSRYPYLRREIVVGDRTFFAYAHGYALWYLYKEGRLTEGEISQIKGVPFLPLGASPYGIGWEESNWDNFYSRITNEIQQQNLEDILSELQEQIDNINSQIEENSLFTNAQVNSEYSYLADFNINIEPSLKIVEIPLEEKRMRIVDHPPNDFLITPHHLLDQSSRLAFYCKYDTFSMNAVTYPPVLSARDTQNREAYLTGHDLLQISKLTQESVSRPRFLEVYRTTTKPVNYEAFSGTLRNTIDLKQSNGDIPTDHLFIERVRENTIYYYAFRSINENGVAGQMSPVFEAELVNDGGYVYGRFQQYSEEDLAVPEPKEPLVAVKKLFNIVPNIQHLELDTSAVDFVDSSSTAIDNIQLGPNVIDPLFRSDANRYFKIRLTSKKTGRKLDINIGFDKKVRK